MAAGNPAFDAGTPTIEKKFWLRVQKTAGCWLWTGALSSDGYGVLAVDRRKVGTHRLSYELHFGPIPDDLSVLHRCDVPNCVRPDHLFLGTQQDNMLDAVAKGRVTLPDRPKGVDSRNAKLTDEQVREIRLAKGRYRDIGARYGVSAATVCLIRSRKRWAHVA